MTLLPRSLYAADPVDVARRLLGALVVHRHPSRGELVGRIVETEAYRGEEDLACHASRGLTERTRVMYGPPGHAYVYLIYGMYDMLNVVTWPEGQPAAGLRRAQEPLAGIVGRTDGPGRLTRALGIDRSLNGADLCGDRLRIVAGEAVPAARVSLGPRVGVDYAGEWAARPWRFWDAQSLHVSRSTPRRPPGSALGK